MGYQQCLGGGRCKPFFPLLLWIVAVAPFALHTEALAQVAGDAGSAEKVKRASPCIDDSSYDNFISKYQGRPLGSIYGDDAQVEVIITSIKGDDRPEIAKNANCRGIAWDGIKVTTAGTSYTDFLGESAGRSGPIKLSANSFVRLEAFLKSLPDDGHIVPAPGHRVLVRAALCGAISTRVYDRADLPDEIIEIVRLTDSRIEIPAPIFEPSKKWRADAIPQNAISSPVLRASDMEPELDFEPNKSVAESLDGRLFAISKLVYQGYRLRVYIADSEKPQFDLLLPPNAGRTIRPTYIGFSPDGSRLLLETDAPELRVYETKTWKQLTDALIVPSKTVTYIPSQDWLRGVAEDSTGRTILWGASAHRMIAALDIKGQLRSASFSPDGKLLALTSGPGEFRHTELTLWNADSGNLLRKLWSLQWRPEAFGSPLWWGEGRFLVASTSGYVSHGTVGIWDISTGRFKGSLSGCGGAFVVVEGDRLFQHCSTNQVLEWSAEKVRADMRQTQ
ncbi:MAG: hypothetical protein ABSB60_19165 [Terracidiphilus sp.]